MSTKTKSKSSQGKKNKPAANIVWFEIPADDPQRAKKFYGALFGWKINAFPEMKDYWHIDTGGSDDTPDGGLMSRKHSKQPITNYINVPSVTKFVAKVEKLGGKIMKSKSAVPQMGYFAICRDTEGNEFAIWERNGKAK
jgi:predicted enzyme related to lactoylglutathione lyase